MSRRYAYDDKAAFLDKLRGLLDEGVHSTDMETVTPYHVHEAEHILKPEPSKLKYFTLTGALAGLFTGFALTIYTVLDWPMITGGKPLISIPAFLVIAFELTILFGAIASFAGFLILGRLPSLKSILQPEEHDNQFVIKVSGQVDSTPQGGVQ